MPPTITNNKTFRRHEHQIENVVQKAVTAQVINLSVKDICNTVKISRQTFYAHYSSVNDVQRMQEQRLQADFKRRIGIITKREIIFTIMLTFVQDNSNYFSVVLGRKDLRLLTWMIDYVRPRLVPRDVTDISYYQYRGCLKSTIQIWVLSDRHTKQHLPFYVNELLRTRIMRSQLSQLPSFAESAIHPAQIQCQTNIVQ